MSPLTHRVGSWLIAVQHIHVTNSVWLGVNDTNTLMPRCVQRVTNSRAYHMRSVKAAEGRRSPRRCAHARAVAPRASVLDCASPLALCSKGWSVGDRILNANRYQTLSFFSQREGVDRFCQILSRVRRRNLRADARLALWHTG